MNIVYLFDHLNVDVPVELWLDKNDIVNSTVDVMKKRWNKRLRVKCIDDYYATYFSEFGSLQASSPDPFHLKPLVIVASEFERVLWLDNDAFFVDQCHSSREKLF